MKRFIALFIALGCLFSLPIFDSVGSARAAETIKMGALLDLTGAVASLGPLFRNGILDPIVTIGVLGPALAVLP